MPGMKEMRAAHASQSTQRRSQILMIARRENTAASLSEARNALTIARRQSIARVHREKPELIEVGFVEPAQHLFVAVGVCLAIASSNVKDAATLFVGE